MIIINVTLEISVNGSYLVFLIVDKTYDMSVAIVGSAMDLEYC